MNKSLDDCKALQIAGTESDHADVLVMVKTSLAPLASADLRRIQHEALEVRGGKPARMTNSVTEEVPGVVVERLSLHSLLRRRMPGGRCR